MAVTLHHYSLPLRSIVKQGYSPSVQTPDPVETSTLWLPGDLRVCSLSSWDTTYLATQVPTSLLPSLLSHQKTHTHTNIFSPFDVYFTRSHQFTMLVWEWVFSWLAISKKADLWRHNFKVSDIFYSVTLCLSLCFSRVSHSGLAEFTFSFDSASFFDSASYFGTLFGFDLVS